MVRVPGARLPELTATIVANVKIVLTTPSLALSDALHDGVPQRRHPNLDLKGLFIPGHQNHIYASGLLFVRNNFIFLTNGA